VIELEIKIKIVIERVYKVSAPTLDEAKDMALEKAIEEYPGADVYLV
jgi:hypothetical protein